jgi:hypothetical protein
VDVDLLEEKSQISSFRERVPQTNGEGERERVEI